MICDCKLKLFVKKSYCKLTFGQPREILSVSLVGNGQELYECAYVHTHTNTQVYFCQAYTYTRYAN